MDQETVRLLCLIGYGVVGFVGVYSALTFILCAVYFREWSPGTALKALNLDGPKPRGETIVPNILEVLVALAAFWVYWYYSGDAGDMPRHLLRVTAYVVGAWVIYIGLLILHILGLRVYIRRRWTQAVVAQHEKRLAEAQHGEAHQVEAQQAATTQTEAHLDPDVFRV